MLHTQKLIRYVATTIIAQALLTGFAFAETQTTSSIELNVLDYGATSGGDVDNTQAFQRALDECAWQGGGTVYAPVGQYRFDGHLQVPAYVTLRGSAHAPPTTSDSSSTLFLVYSGHNQEHAEPFLTLTRCSTIRGFQVHYPQQKPDAIVPYPWCVRGHGDNIGIRDVLLINPYKAVDFGTFPCGRHYIDGLYAQALHTGLFIDKCYDVGRVYNVHFWPFWTEQAMAYTREHGTAFIIAKTDWQFMRDCFTIAYKVGFHFTEVESGPGNVVLSQCGADIGPIAVLVDSVQRHAGVSFSNSQFMAGIIVKDTNMGPLKFTSSGFWGVEGVTGSHAEISGTGHVTFNGCHFTWWDMHRTGAPAIVANSGGVTIMGCEFIDELSTTRHIHLGEDVEVALVQGNRFRVPPHIENRSEGEVVILGNAGGKKHRLMDALDRKDASAVAQVWRQRLANGNITSQPITLRLASAVVIGDQDKQLRKQLLESIANQEVAESQFGGQSTFTERARRELMLDEGGGEPGAVALSMTAAPLGAEIQIDGYLEEKQWNSTTPTEMVTGEGADATTMSVRLLYDDKGIHLGAQIGETRMQQLKADVTRRDGPVWTNDSIEFFLCPGRITHRYLQLIVSSNGTWYDGTGTLHTTDSSWQANPKIATSRHDDHWTIEMMLPWSDIEAEPQPGDVWGVDLRRWRFAGRAGKYQSWSGAPLGGDTHNPEAFGFLTFAKN